MLAVFRHSSAVKAIQYLFVVICFVMIASPLMSVFSASPMNAIALKNKYHKITMKDLLSRDQHLLQVLHTIKAPSHSPLVTHVVSDYYRSASYSDFFQKYGCRLSDSVAWNWFLNQFGSQGLSQQQYAALQQNIKKNYGTQKQFLATIKPQLLAQQLQDQVLHLLTPQQKYNPVDYPLTYTLLQYNFSPRDYRSQVPVPSQDELRNFYESHLEDYRVPAQFDLQALTFEPTDIDLRLVDPQWIEKAQETLFQSGYERDDQVALQKQIFWELQSLLADKSFYSIHDAIQVYPFLNEALIQNLENITESDSKQLFAQQDDVFTFLEAQYQDSGSLPPVLSLNSAEQLTLLAPTAYRASRFSDYDDVASTIIIQWRAQQAGLLAQQAADCFVSDYKASDAESSKPAAFQYVIANLLNDMRFSNKEKIALSHLVAADIEKNKSIYTSFDGQEDSGVKVFILKSVELSSLEDRESQEQLSQILSSQAYQAISVEALNHHVDQECGYRIEPAFWSMIDRMQTAHI